MASSASFENGDFLSDYREALRRAASAKAALENTERRRKRVFSELVDASGLAVSKAEYAAACHPRVKELDDVIEGLRVEAGEADAEVTYMSARLDVWRSRVSKYKAELLKGQ